MKSFLDKLLSFMPWWMGWGDIRHYSDHVSVNFYSVEGGLTMSYSFELVDSPEIEIRALANNVIEILRPKPRVAKPESAFAIYKGNPGENDEN